MNSDVVGVFLCDKVLLYEHQRCSGSRGLVLNKEAGVCMIFLHRVKLSSIVGLSLCTYVQQQSNELAKKSV